MAANKPDPASTAKVQDAETLNQTKPDKAVKDNRAEDTLVTQSPVQTKDDGVDKALPGNGASAEVETIKVKTKGDYILMDPFSAKHVTREGNEVPVTSWVNDQLEEGGGLEKA